MEQPWNRLAGPVLDAVHWFQSRGHVRAAESAFLTVFLGGFYLLAFARVINPYGQGALYDVLTGVSVELQVTLTVVGPFAIVVLEWLSGVAQLRERPDYGTWSLGRRLSAWIGATTASDLSPLVYLPLAPLAFLWTAVMAVQSSPFWPVPAVIFLFDAGVLIVSNWVEDERPEPGFLSRRERRG
jgi:hypothetical protein